MDHIKRKSTKENQQKKRKSLKINKIVGLINDKKTAIGNLCCVCGGKAQDHQKKRIIK
jgi:hypothetical protein